MEILLLVLGLLFFVGLVVVHEFGHFIMARRNGVEVEEFGIGFPPKIARLYKDKKGTEYTVNVFPLGGFVRLKGEHDQDKQKGAFGAAIILAGVVMNVATAWVLFTILTLIGIPKLPLPGGEEQFTVPSDTKIVRHDVFAGYVSPGSPAETAGLASGDVLRSIVPRGCDGLLESNCRYTINTSDDLRRATQDLAGQTVTLNFKESENDYDTSKEVTLLSKQEVEDSANSDNPKGYLGVVPTDYIVQRSTWSAPIVAAGLSVQFTKITLEALADSIGSLFVGNVSQASENVSGPVGIFVVLRDGASLGFSYILLIIGLLSLTLAIMNALPIPALDGGKLAVMLLFRAIKKPLTPLLEERIHMTGFFALMGLFVLITIVDVGRFF